MRRRSFLAAGAVTAAVGLAGCMGGDGADGDRTRDDAGGPAVADATFTVLSRGESGVTRDEASYRYADGSLEISGTIVGSDACKTAQLADALYDREREAIVVDVETVDAPGAGDMCAEVLTPIDYEVTVEVEGGEPAVVVRHDGEDVDADETAPAG